MRKTLSSAGTLFRSVLFIGIAVALTSRGGQKDAGISAPVANSAQPVEQKQEQPKQTYAVQDVPGGTEVRGRVLFSGTLVPAKKTAVTQDREVCGQEQVTYPVRIEKGGIVDAVVWIENIDHGKPFDFPAPVLSQKSCVYVPHVILMQPGELTVETKDPVSHNIHIYAEFNRSVNVSLNQIVQSTKISLMHPERVGVRCDVHGWMNAFVVVANNPYYAVTGDGGQFELDRVPSGHYRLKVWQESLGESEKDIDVEAGKPTVVEFDLQQKS